jgi:membrane protease YdiL (CAAX protease family)
MSDDLSPGPVQQSLARRWVEGVLFVAAWVGMGWSLRLDGNSYLLLGVPLTVAFQLAVCRAPLGALWVRGAPPPRRGWLLPALALAVLPGIAMAEELGRRDWVVAGWMLSAMGGAFAAGYALRHLRRDSARPFLLCLLTAGSIGVLIVVVNRFVSDNRLPPRPLTGLNDFLLYFPVCFALEEVSFRGALDSHLHHPGDPMPQTSAFLGAALWGLWHLPVISPEARGFRAAYALTGVHVLIGFSLALYWRKSGNLAVPAFTHAFIDAVRNALRLMG